MEETLKFTGFDSVHLSGALAMGLTLLYILSTYATKYPLELVILAVALVSYLLLSSLPNKYWLRIRYVDWFVTVPLLVYVVAQFGSMNFFVLGGSAFAMLAAGYLAILGNVRNYNTLINWGFAFYALFMGLLLISKNTLPWWILLFFVSWGLYGFVDRIEGPRDNWVYTILDILNKPVFIILLLRHLDSLQPADVA